MKQSNTAEVEVLTAEVRALMIGKRQVTLSVYRQLDEADADQIEPFGRVRDSKDDGEAIYVVGRQAETGELVRSHTIRPFLRLYIRDSPLHPGDTRESRCARMAAERETLLDELWPPVEANLIYLADSKHGAVVVTTAQEGITYGEQWLSNTAEWRRRYADWCGLPLIILAGLR